jgi:uncharacterized membrane protein
VTLPTARSRPLLAVAALAAAYALVYGAICLVKHRYYLYDDFDLAIFTQAVDAILRGAHFVSIRGMSFLGDHSSLILYAVAPVYALFRDPQTLLVLQTLALAAGAFPVFAIARRELESDRVAVGCAALYLLYPALGFLNLFEFHPEAFATPALLFAFRYLLERRALPAIAAAAVALLCREDVPLVVLPMAAWAWWIHRRVPAPCRERTAPAWVAPAALVTLAIAALVLSFAVFKPRFNAGEAGYFQMYSQWGASASEVLAGVARNPAGAVAQLFTTPNQSQDSALKLQFHLFLLAPLAFLPLASPLTLALALPVLGEHLLSNRPQQHQIVYQYTALLIPVYVVAAILGLRNLARGRQARAKAARARGNAAARTALAPGNSRARTTLFTRVAVGAAIVSQIAFGPLLGGGRIPAAASPEPIWPNAYERQLRPHRDRMMSRIPPDGAVIAGFEFLSRLARRPQVHSLHHVFRGTYTYSDRPYPRPDSVAAIVADFASPHLLDYVGAGKTQRIQNLLGQNRLAPVDAVDDLVLFVREPADPLPLILVSRVVPPGPPVVFDGQLAFLGGGVRDSVARAGDLVRFDSEWTRGAEIDRTWFTGVLLIDDGGRPIQQQARHLGYACYPPETWLAGSAVREHYRLMLPAGLTPGTYHVGLRVAWARGGQGGPGQTDDPTVRAQGGVIRLGRVRVVP